MWTSRRRRSIPTSTGSTCARSIGVIIPGVDRPSPVIAPPYGASHLRSEFRFTSFSSSARFPMLLVIDNYDSFTYNLVQYLGELGADLEVRRNDVIDVAGVRAMAPQAIVISPGP